MNVKGVNYVRAGVYVSTGRRFRFEKWTAADAWFIYEASPHPEDLRDNDGFYDVPSFGIRFRTLREAVEFVEDLC